MKRFAALAALLGFCLFGVLLAMSGLEDVGGAVATAGWGTALVVVARAVAVAGAGIAWNLLVPVGARVSMGVGVLLRFIREAVNQLLPVGQVGGDLVGARLATFWRMEGALAGAVTIADVALQAGTQLVFALMGLAILVWLHGDGEIVRVALIGLALASVAIGAFFLVQARFGSQLLLPLLQRLAGGREWAGIGLVERIWARLGEIYADRTRVAGVTVLHLGVWMVGSSEVYIALNWMGHPVTIAEAIVIESLGQAVRGAAFAVPGGLGVQEGGYIAIAGLFGIPPGPALALSLLKRVADLALGLPFLAVWQVLEGRRLASRPADAAVVGAGR